MSAFEQDTARFLRAFTDTRTGNAGYRAMVRAQAIQGLVFPLSAGWRHTLEAARVLALEDCNTAILDAIDQALARLDYSAQPPVYGQTYRCTGPGSKRGYNEPGQRHPECEAAHYRHTLDAFGVRHVPRTLRADSNGDPIDPDRYELKHDTEWKWDPGRKRFVGMVRTVQNSCKLCRALPIQIKATA